MWVRKQQQDGDGNKDDNDGVSVGSDLFVRNTRHNWYRNMVGGNEQNQQAVNAEDKEKEDNVNAGEEEEDNDDDDRN